MNLAFEMATSAGTLISTHNADYIPPRFMPSYGGHFPTMNIDCAETYGNHSAKYFQDFRNHTLETSRINMCQGGYFPSLYSFGPHQAVESRTRTWDRWEKTPPCRLLTQDHDRRQELIHFGKLSQATREHYSDKTGSVDQVEHFQLPNPADEAFKSYVPFARLSTMYSDDISIPFWDHQPQLGLVYRRKSLHVPTMKDRSFRDKYCENRQKYH